MKTRVDFVYVPNTVVETKNNDIMIRTKALDKRGSGTPDLDVAAIKDRHSSVKVLRVGVKFTHPLGLHTQATARSYHHGKDTPNLLPLNTLQNIAWLTVQKRTDFGEGLKANAFGFAEFDDGEVLLGNANMPS